MASSSTTVTGRYLTADTAASASQYITFRLKNTGADDDVTPEEVYARKPISVQTDASGDFSTTLWVNGDSDVSSVYEVKFPDGETYEFVIPTAASGGTIDLATLIALHQPSGTTQQSSVYAQAIDRTNHTGGPDDLNGNEIILDVDGDTSITADTDDRIDFKIGGTDELTLTAAKADNLDDIAALTPTDEAVLRGNGTDWVIATNFRVDAGTNNSGTEMGTGVANGNFSVAEGTSTTASGLASHAEGTSTTASGSFSHAEGANTTASGARSHAEGNTTTASGADSHAEGYLTTASGDYSSATGRRGQAIHDGARVEADSQDADVSSTTTDQFTARFQNGYEFKGGHATFDGGLSTSTTSVTATTYTTLVTDSVILVDDDTAGAAVTITLLAAATAGDGFQLTIKKIGNTASVTVDGNGSETIDGATTAVLNSQYESITLTTNGTSWYVL